jgi:hypothetical protein
MSTATDDAVRRMPVEDRFWSKVRRGGTDECWEWTAGTNDDGYGVIKVDGRDTGAHRIAWVLIARRGPVPDGMVVMHSCDNPPCVNPAHLSLGTVADNNADRHAKGRTVMPTNGPDFWRAKTHCPQNHPYDGDNVRYRKDGRRRCAACYRERAAARHVANRDQINARKRAARAAKRSS